MSIQKEENNRPFKPQIKQKRGRGQSRQNFVTEVDIDHSVGIDKDKILDLTIGENCKIDTYNVDKTVGEEVTDIRIIIIIEMTVEIEGDKTLGEASVMTMGIEADQEKEV